MRAAVACALLCAASCRNAPPELSDFVPPDTTALAGIDLASLRASPLYSKIPVAVPEAASMLVAWDGKSVLMLIRGDFRQPPPGYVTLAPGMAATRPLPRGKSPLPVLQSPAWAVIRGDGALPLSGNLANARNLLRDATETTISVQPADPVEIAIEARCPNESSARHFEESVRALATLARLRPVEIERQDLLLRVRAKLPAAVLGKVF